MHNFHTVNYRFYCNGLDITVTESTKKRRHSGSYNIKFKVKNSPNLYFGKYVAGYKWELYLLVPDKTTRYAGRRVYYAPCDITIDKTEFKRNMDYGQNTGQFSQG